MPLAILIAAILIGSPAPERHPVRGGFFDAGGCERLEGWKVLPPFEEVSGDALGDTMEFKCALALYLDSQQVTDAQKFEHLAKQALRGEKWAVALSEPMARLDFSGHQHFILKHAKSLQPAVWYRTCLMASGWRFDGGPRASDVADRWKKTPWVPRLFYEQALHSQDDKVRHCMTGYFNNSSTTEAEARGFASRLSVEEAPEVRARIFSVQLWLHNSRVNKLVRDFLGGPLEFEVLDELCGSSSKFLAAKRYDFLPDLKALRARLPGVIAAENDVRRKNQVKKDAERVMGDLDILIAALEKKQAEDERDAKAKGDAGSPAKEARGTTK